MKTIAYSLLLAASLAACNRVEKAVEPPKSAVAAPPTSPMPAAAPQPPTAARINETELMRAIFGDAYKPADKKATATLVIEGSEMLHAMTPVASTQLADGRVVLIVNGAPAADDGSEIASHVSSGILNVYLLRREGDGWKVLQRHENLAELGSEGFIGSVKWVTLGPGKPGFIVSNGGVWQGYSISHAAIFELGSEVRGLGSFKEASSNEGGCGPTSGQCWDVAGEIRFAPEPQQSGYNDIIVSFTDKRFTVTEDKNADFVIHPGTTTKTSARYHFDGKAYVLASGANPVPDI
ncbi:hypothetical protein FHW58_004349 [Duganella sp. 1224]|uniref:hypothetical protein n=1 Tax=Duganella sp. 1224 TaxID=2587052 RepID=UPI0015CC51B5|nr:hypothetical protein [Duganella sp. 1224]NYE63121.1 hypothetical protein [Duganella sp. 1224]